jgi:hypothetical protein
MAVVKARSLKDLAAIKAQLEADAARAAAEKAERERLEKAAQAERHLFKRAVGAVKPLSHAPRVSLSGEPAKPLALQQMLDDDNVLRESLSDRS